MLRSQKMLPSLVVILVISLAFIAGLVWAQGGPPQNQSPQGAPQQPGPGVPGPQAPAATAQDIICSKLQQPVEKIQIGDVSIPYSRILVEFYAQRQCRPAWTNAQAGENLLRAIRESEGDGLLPEDYHL